jgi:DNA-binding Lrp family transcriptional regulator
MMGLFGKVAKELKFSDSRATLFAGAFVWWFVNYHTITNITIHSITAIITDLDDSAVKERITDDATRVVASKVNIAKRFFVERKLDATVKKALIQLTKNDKFDAVPGMKYIREVVAEDLPRSEIIDHFNKCIDEISKKAKREINNTGERISRYSRIIENSHVIKNYMEEEEEEAGLDAHVKKNLTVLSKSADLTEKQRDLLEKTCLKMASIISSSAISGMSRHTIASVIIYLALLYHGKRVNLSQIADELNSSKSTLGVRTRKWEKKLGFKKCEARLGEYGYLTPTKKGSILHELGKSVRFSSEPKNDVMRDLITELINLSESANSSDYVAARFVLVQMLMTRGRMSDKDIIEALRHYFNDGSQRHIRWNARMRNKQCISSTTEIICRDGDHLYISPRFSECINDAFETVDQFIQLCNLKRFNRDTCESSLSILQSRLEKERDSIPDKIIVNDVRGSKDDSELNALIITMRLDDRSYGEIKKKIHETFPTEDRELRNYIYKIWRRYQKEND